MKNVSKRFAAGFLLAASLIVVTGGTAVRAQDDAGPFGNKPDTTPLAEPDMAQIIDIYGLVESKLPVSQTVKGWRRPKKILVELDNNVHRLDWLKEVVPPDVELVGVKRGDNARYQAEIKDADGVFGSCNKDSFANVGPNFHWLHNNGVGIDQCFTGGIVPPRLRDGSVVITNSARLEGNSVANHSITLMLALSRGLDQYVKQDETGKFTTEVYPRLWSLQGKTILVAGLGGVGSGIASLAHGIGMRVIATNGSIPDHPPAYIEHIGLPNELESMVGQADVVITALPLTAETTHLFNKDLFAKFKKGAIFINCTREDEQVDQDVVDAINSGELSSTGQDSVTNDSPLWQLKKNIIITPHVAAQNVDPMLSRGGEQTWDVARENLKRYIAGDKMLSVVDPVHD